MSLFFFFFQKIIPGNTASLDVKFFAWSSLYTVFTYPSRRSQMKGNETAISFWLLKVNKRSIASLLFENSTCSPGKSTGLEEDAVTISLYTIYFNFWRYSILSDVFSKVTKGKAGEKGVQGSASERQCSSHVALGVIPHSEKIKNWLASNASW